MVFLVGIAGGSGSGKTTFAEKVVARLKHQEITVLHMDSYYLRDQLPDNYTKRGHPNFDHPKAFDWTLLRDHLQSLKKGSPIDSPIYDFKTSSRTDKTLAVEPAKVILFEGIFTLYDPAIRDLLDIMCFLHVEADIRFTRRLHRDVQERGRSLESVIDQYYETVRPMYQKYLDPQKQYADFIVGEETDIAASILAAKIKEMCDAVTPCKESLGLKRNYITSNIRDSAL